MERSAILVITTTSSAGDARAIAAHLLEKKLAACVQILPVESHFVWQEKIQSEKEFALHIKAPAAKFEDLRQAVCDIHTYEVPEIICLNIQDAHQPYLDWLHEVTE